MPPASRDDRFHPNDLPTPDDYRSPAQHDRDRVIYTSAFRRLAGVTQVVAAGERQLFHNRLTHTLEVAQIGRRLAERALRLQGEVAGRIGGIDPEVVEAAALAHDLGHPPFGHIAEEELDDLVVGAKVPDGFEGNAQSFRIVTKLAVRHQSIVGLNLTRATLNAICKYPWLRQTGGPERRKWNAYTSERADLQWARESDRGGERKSAEAELMDWADDIAYSLHDVEDFYRAGLIPLDRLRESDNEAQRFLADVFARWKQGGIEQPYGSDVYESVFDDIRAAIPVTEPYSGARDQRARLHTFKSALIGRYVTALQLREPHDPGESRVEIPPLAKQQVTLLKELTWTYVITNPSLATQQHGQRHVIRRLFEIFCEAAGERKRWAIFPPASQEQLREVHEHTGEGQARDEARTRIVTDLIAEMTEQQAVDIYARLTGISFGSVLETIV